jgi:kinesin family protein 20
VLDSLPEDEPSDDVEPTQFTLDRNHEYTVWLSYAEVYNERVYDLLAPSSRPATPGVAPLLARKALPLKSSPPGDAWDSDAAAGKYADGLRHVRVQGAAQAKAVLRLGQLHRRVFGTLANSQSSRSHAVVTIKLLRQHRGERNVSCTDVVDRLVLITATQNPSAIQVSRLTLVDLAGSERTKHTQTSGDRLKEAGSINKSLMVLGQCLDTLRMNQRRLAQSLGGSGRSDTRDVRKALQVVPFRHSKMTEMLMDYFVGDGRVVSEP